MNERILEAGTTASSPLLITGTMLTHPGYQREDNEDVVSYFLSEDARDLLALVADGMGGHLAGEVASRIAADTVAQFYHSGPGSPPDRLAACMTTANQTIYHRSLTDPACSGMGTTCTVLAVHDGAAFLAHIGDSRAYIWRDGTLYQVSEDHSLVAAMVRDGSLTEEEAVHHPSRNILLKALGTHAECEPLIWGKALPLISGDKWMLCSDGLSDHVDASVIAETLAGLPPVEACRALLERALDTTAPDNISIGVFGVELSSSR